MKLPARQGTDFRSLWNADEGAAKAESVGQDGDNQRDPEGQDGGASHRCEKRIVAVPPESLTYAQEPDRRQQIDGQLADARELAEERSDRKAGGEKREKKKRDQKADVERDSTEQRIRKDRHKKAD